ncbi:hypothetical protein Bcop_1925 [Bacteroides coprosuis DSM 18011]|uniref:Uncharacterized protein n=1 Tax=Bacteroides coprosuis DSM 18011 TaxID=679937 RepID=F3ZS83_9BACE|nr:hypothetical protein [Bacteroides coprosuis]EGJ72104.1 hypothetical protein Bcop_1925 [Bacteroides coprosuis DSM 18011]
MRVKNVGENLFTDKIKIQDTYSNPGYKNYITDNIYLMSPFTSWKIKFNKYESSLELMASDDGAGLSCFGGYTSLKPNTEYTISYKIESYGDKGNVGYLVRRWGVFDVLDNIDTNKAYSHKFTTDNDGNYRDKTHYFFWTNQDRRTDYIKFSNIMLYESDKALLEYIPYTESNLYLNSQLELKSIGAVSDYIENGKLYKNIMRLRLGDIPLGWSPVESKYGKGRIWTKLSYNNLPDNYYKGASSIIPNFYTEGVKKNNVISGNVSNIRENDEVGIGWHTEGEHITYTSETSFKFSELLEECKEFYVIYPTRTTKVIDLSTSGNLITYPNGTIFIDNAIQLEEQYQDGITIKEGYPIQILESIKVGKEYLDVSKAIVKDNLITHPELENGDFVTIEYIYDDNPIYGTNSIGYLSLEEILDDLWLDNVYTYKVTNGEWELVKVTDIEDYEEWLKTEKISPYTLAPDAVIFGTYEAETKFIRQYPSSLYVDIIAPTRLKEGITQIKARALVGTADGVIENPSKYFDISWYKKSNKAGASDVIIGEGEELTINVADVDRIGIEVESKAIKE